jgi:hypothetical protein
MVRLYIGVGIAQRYASDMPPPVRIVSMPADVDMA